MEDNKQTLNPWFSMWTKPRATIQQIVDTDPKHLVLVLAAAFGFNVMLGLGVGLKDDIDLLWPEILFGAAIFGPIYGIFILYIFFGWIVYETGKWINGKASPQNIRAAVAWSYVPVIWMMILWLPKLALLDQETSIAGAMRTIPLLSLFAIIDTAVGIWGLVIFTKCVGQVQGFSAWKALLSMVLGWLVIFICTVAIVLIGVLIGGIGLLVLFLCIIILVAFKINSE